MIILQQMVVFFIMMVVGYFVRRAEIVTPQNQAKFSQLVADVCGPCMIASAAANATDRMSGDAVVVTFATLVALVVVMMLVGAIVPVILRYPKNERGTVNMMTWFTNIGFLGMPLTQAVYGPQAMIYLTFYLMMTNVLVYSYGIYCVGGRGGGNVRDTLRALVNPGTIACILSFIIYFGEISIPYVLLKPIDMVGGMTSPLAMMLIGVSVADASIKHMFTDKRMLGFAFLTMLFFPVLVTLGFKMFVADPSLLAVCMVIVATPAGAMVGILASIHNRDVYVLASEGAILTTTMSVLTLPIVSMLTGV